MEPNEFRIDVTYGIMEPDEFRIDATYGIMNHPSLPKAKITVWIPSTRGGYILPQYVYPPKKVCGNSLFPNWGILEEPERSVRYVSQVFTSDTWENLLAVVEAEVENYRKTVEDVVYYYERLVTEQPEDSTDTYTIE